MDGMIAPRYTVNTAKVVEVILWLATAKPGIDVYHVVKCAFYADKFHLGAFGRPVTGDDYDAATYGPLGRCLYGLLKGDPIELLALGTNGRLPFHVSADTAVVHAERDPNTRLLSQTDISMLERAVADVGDLSFADLVELTHEEPAYQAANGGRMNYEDFIDHDDPDWEGKVAELRETARSAIL